jgi:hypothetical protein
MAKQKQQLRQARLDERAEQIRRQAEAEARTRNLIIAGFVLLLLVGGGVLWVLATNPFAQKITANSGWTDTSYAVPDEGHDHIPANQPPTYKHQPPSSGPHYNQQGAGPLAIGNYQQEQSPGGWVHNLEHGYVVLVYRCDSDCGTIYNEIQQEWSSIPKDPEFNEVKMVATQYQSMQPKFALLVWDRELDMKTFDTNTIEGFYQKYVDHGREDLA